MEKSKLKKFLGEMEKFKARAVLYLGYKKRNDGNIFHSSTKLIASNSDIGEEFKSMHINAL